jgi:hypothetical protein
LLEGYNTDSRDVKKTPELVYLLYFLIFNIRKGYFIITPSYNSLVA